MLDEATVVSDVVGGTPTGRHHHGPPVIYVSIRVF